MTTEHAPKARPYWHVDAKWVAALLLVFFLSWALLILGLVQVTAEQRAIDTVSMALAVAFSPGGLDEQIDVNELLQRLGASPDGSIQPMPGLRITLQESDTKDLSPRELRLYFFRQLAKPLYDDGPQELLAVAEDSGMTQRMIKDTGLLSLLTRDAHRALQRGLVVLGLVSLGLFIPLVLFSYRFGRIGSPGLVLFLTSLPGLLACASARRLLLSFTPLPFVRGQAGIVERIGALASSVLPSLVQVMYRNYVICLLLGLALTVVALLGSAIWRLTR